ncbi:MAG: haloacid dehalogenase-like hydrolase [Clostridiales bacterium]|nr:haloacid dehalogenase-like hydrolase [Clostridiales bacterium]
MELDIYDFDKTVIPFDSGRKFFSYCLLHYPKTLIFLPWVLVGCILFALRIIDFAALKTIFFSFVRVIPLRKAVDGFWAANRSTVREWAKPENRERYSVVISASPDFLIEGIIAELGFDSLICTVHDRRTGALLGSNCKGEEKIKRFRTQYPDAQVICVYSDSYRHDKPIFSLGKSCIHIEANGKTVPFEFRKIYS